jgi:hypothetical protein
MQGAQNNKKQKNPNLAGRRFQIRPLGRMMKINEKWEKNDERQKRTNGK